MTPSRDWSRFALLLIDVQNDFWSEDIAHDFPDFPANVERLLHFCRNESIDIVHIRACFQPDKSDWMAKYIVKGSIPCVRGTPGAEALSFALGPPGETVMIKQTFDAFHSPALLTHLRQNDKRFILTAGLVTSVCVFLTTASAAQQGFLTAIVEDCCADTTHAHDAVISSYPFIFERTTIDRLTHHYDRWTANLEKLDRVQGFEDSRV